MKGKNFSANNASGKRNKSDFYQTPYALTCLLLDTIILEGSILEPAYGEGAITKVLTERGYRAVSYDKEENFLTETTKYDTIITNPPFSLAFEFIQKAQEIAQKEFFMLLPLSYLHGKKRYDAIYTDSTYPLKKVHVFTRYPLLEETIREDGKHQTGMMVYAWFQFTKLYKGSPTIAWLDNNEYVVRRD